MGLSISVIGKIGHIVKFPDSHSISGLPDPDKTGPWGGIDINSDKDYLLSQIIQQPPSYIEETGLLYIMIDHYGRKIVGILSIKIILRNSNFFLS